MQTPMFVRSYQVLLLTVVMTVLIIGLQTDALSTDAHEQDSDFILSKDSNIKWYTAEPHSQKKRSSADIVQKTSGRVSGVEPSKSTDSFW